MYLLRYTRLMRLTVATASLYVFTLLTMIWFNVDYRKGFEKSSYDKNLINRKNC